MDLYLVKDVMKILGVSKSKAYKVIQDMNEELKEKGYFIIAGKVPKTYFEERFYFQNNRTSDNRKRA